jgi:hypothetical protein
MLGLVYEPEEGSCRSCSSIAPAGAVRRKVEEIIAGDASGR